MFYYDYFFRTSNDKLFSINEEVQREALKGFYDRCLRNDKYSINSKDTPHCQTKIIT